MCLALFTVWSSSEKSKEKFLSTILEIPFIWEMFVLLGFLHITVIIGGYFDPRDGGPICATRLAPPPESMGRYEAKRTG